MSKPTWWDEYEVKARYIPTFLSVTPLVHFLVLFLGNTFWNELIANVGWMVVVADLSLSLIVMIALVQVQCSFGKHWIEENVFGKGGERFPTTEMLLYSGGLISSNRKELLRSIISNLFSCTFSSITEEIENPENARQQAREAVGHIRSYVGRGIMTFQYNIRYGFIRNLIGGVLWGAIGSIGCSIIYGSENAFKAMSLFIVFAMIFIALYLSRKIILDKFAFYYADSLFNDFLVKKEEGGNG